MADTLLERGIGLPLFQKNGRFLSLSESLILVSTGMQM
jgi:hypothetical protein